MNRDDTIELKTADESLPRVFGTYTLLRRIGIGGMGTVYEALQAQPRRHVALKLIRADEMSDDRLRRFSIEVQALGRLHHPGIAEIYEGGNVETGDGPQPYFVMELVQGLTLDEYVSKRRVGIRECLRVMTCVAEAVHHAHLQDVIHRDLKPANILVDENGQPKILDFGVARMVGGDRVPAAAATQTVAGVVLGTLAYMSPEQTEADPDRFDQRSDVYALGVIAYTLLAGRLPYRFKGGLFDAINVIHEEMPEPLGDVDTRLRGDPETVVGKALAKERKQRYPTAQAFADDLRAVCNGFPISVTPVTFADRIRRWTMREDNIRHAGWAGVVGHTLVGMFNSVWALIGVLAWFWWPVFLPKNIRYTDFMINTTAWTVVEALLAWVNWRVMHKHLPSMWIALAGHTAESVFTAGVLINVIPYDGGGGLQDPLLRVALYTLFTPLAFLGVFASVIALITAYRRREWDRPLTSRIAMVDTA